MKLFTGPFHWFCLVLDRLLFHLIIDRSLFQIFPRFFFWERFDCWLLFPMCQRLNYEILIVRDYVRHNVIMYVIIINVILTSLSICASLLLTKYNVIRDYVRHNVKDCDVIMKYNKNVIPKHIKEREHKGNNYRIIIIRTPFLTEIIVSDLLYFSVVLYKVDINIRCK